jgi:hypothetical protein
MGWQRPKLLKRGAITLSYAVKPLKPVAHQQPAPWYLASFPLKHIGMKLCQLCLCINGLVLLWQQCWQHLRSTSVAGECTVAVAVYTRTTVPAPLGSRLPTSMDFRLIILE